MSRPTGHPRVSVVIPAYNMERYVRETIESVLRQTFSSYEVVVVDDGSTDGTPDVVQAFVPEVQYVYRPNGGLAAARNTGLRESTGEVLVFLDADDVLLPEFLDRQIEVLDAHPEVDVVYSWARFVDADGAFLSDGMRPGPDSVTLPRILVGGNCVLFSLAAVRRKVFDRIGVFDESLRQAQDWDMILRMLARGVRFSGIPRFLVHRRLHESNVSGDPGKVLHWDRIVLEKAFASLPLPSECQSRRPEALFWVVHRAALGYWRRGDRQTAVRRLHEGFALWPEAAYRPQTYQSMLYRLLPPGSRSDADVARSLQRLTREVTGLVSALMESAETPRGGRISRRAVWSAMQAVLALQCARAHHWGEAARRMLQAVVAHPGPPVRGLTLLASRAIRGSAPGGEVAASP